MNLDEYYISKPTIEAVGVFTILWCQFEQYKFNTNASTPKIREYANTFDLSVDLKALVFSGWIFQTIEFYRVPFIYSTYSE